jgi:hypothetical protein
MLPADTGGKINYSPGTFRPSGNSVVVQFGFLAASVSVS